MSRFFSTRYEYRSILDGIERDLTRTIGTKVWWYRFDETSPTDDVYDVGENRKFLSPIALDVIAAIRIEGRDQRRDEGLFTRDRLEVVVSWKEADRRGMGDLSTNTDVYLRDRVVYEGVTFTVQAVEVEGSLRDHDTVLSVSLVEVRPDQQHHDDALPSIY